jgi:dihydrofolate reductase
MPFEPESSEMSEPHLILSMMISDDGFVCGPKGELDWVLWTPEMDVAASALLERADMFAAGHNAFVDIAAYWPAVLANDQAAPEEKAFARKLCSMPKAVIGRTGEAAIWDEQAVLDVDTLGASVRGLSRNVGTLIVYGGVRTAQMLIADDLVDELQLFVSPVLIGTGRSLFASASEMLKRFETVEKQSFAAGGSRVALVNAAQPKPSSWARN